MRTFFCALFLSLSGPTAAAPVDKDYLIIEQSVGFGNDGQPSALFLLQRMQGYCPEGENRMFMVQQFPRAVWVGCWKLVGPRIHFSFEDGDSMEFPAPASLLTPMTHARREG